MSTATTPILTPNEPDKKLRCGSLQYTKAGLFVMFSWLLWGDFCFSVFESVGGPGILGTYLQNELHVSNTQIWLIFSLIPQIIGMSMGIPLSVKSDRYRSRWGRRIPFMLFTTPFLCFFAAAIGFTPEIIEFMKAHVGNHAFISPVTLSLLVVGVLVVGYTFFNEFVQNVYWYLFADVVPEAFMGRFFALFRIVESLASIILGICVTPHQLTHIRWIHVGVAVLYFVGFGTMCFGVKEGTYPPPSPLDEPSGLWKSIFRYIGLSAVGSMIDRQIATGRTVIRECFIHKIYVLIYIASFFSALATIVPIAGVFGLHVGQHKVTTAAHAPGTTLLAATSDGKYVISAGADHLLKLWSRAQKGRLELLKTLDEHKAPITALALSPDNTTAISADEQGQIKFWNLTTGACMRTFAVAPDPIRCLQTLHDGQTLLAGDAAGRLRIWNLETDKAVEVQARPLGQPDKTLDAHTQSLNCIATSSDEKLVATGSSDKTIKLWNPADWSCTQTLPETAGPIYALCFAPSLQPLEPPSQPWFQATWGWVAGEVHALFTNETLYEVPADKRTKVIEPDGWLVYAGRDGATDKEASLVNIWDCKAKKIVHSLKGHSGAITSLEFKPDLRFIMSGSRDTIIRLWDPTNISTLGGDQSLRTISGYTSDVTSIASRPDGPMIVSAADSGELHTWDVDQGVSFLRTGLKGAFFSFLSILLIFPSGMLVDKFRPLRIAILSAFLIAPAQACYYFFFQDYTSLFLLDSVKIPLYILWSAANYPLLMQLFPKSKYGQFCAANSFIRSMVLIGTGLFGSMFMDWITRKALLTDNFRYGYFWICGSYVLIGIAWVLVYREWKKLGGDKNYVPPETVHHETPATVPAKA